jgi:hypothetical protein
MKPQQTPEEQHHKAMWILTGILILLLLAGPLGLSKLLPFDFSLTKTTVTTSAITIRQALQQPAATNVMVDGTIVVMFSAGQDNGRGILINDARGDTISIHCTDCASNLGVESNLEGGTVTVTGTIKTVVDPITSQILTYIESLDADTDIDLTNTSDSTTTCTNGGTNILSPSDPLFTSLLSALSSFQASSETFSEEEIHKETLILIKNFADSAAECF